MTQPAVDVRGLVMRYGETTAVDGLTLAVEPGTVTAVLGPNGAGKTTTIETCEGYRRPQAGTVRVLGLDPVRDAAALRPRVGVMLQDGGAWSASRAGEMLAHIARLYAHPLDVTALSARLGLDTLGRTPYRRMSGGQQQRLALATAIVGRPELVFLDEPTAGLDPQARRAVWDLIDELRESGVTVVLTTHFMDEAERLADWVHLIDHGRLVASGTPADLTSDGAENTLRLRGPAGMDVAGLVTALPSGTQVVEQVPGTYVVSGCVSPALLAAVTAWCAGSGVLLDEVVVRRRSLEDVFLDLTGRELRS
ncbi:ABC-2 type transport system ATP-binding protein [Mumia flava]|uniref:ABC-2 type transport system ATP-binding protein n=1 Tax=Mumia flava TaxID=1348852 RepID=A0A2M9B6M8_9ACTN|nr:ABC transporter ATP-binding protein [Mumia flava]PJJ53599.1 ABC-2 type transport system ATP-binding protein [Mumia flava]